MPQAVFVATLGSEPQVVPLALDALIAQGEKISRVIVVHTLADREPVQLSLERLRHEFVTERFYGNSLLFIPHLLAGSSGPLADVITPNEIDTAFQSLYTLLRQHKHAGNNIHLCVAGGRKTMALFAMAAAQILFDNDDHVWHLVSAPHLVASRKLHADYLKDVTLIPIPLAHWGRLRPDDKQTLHDFIENALTPAEREVTLLLIREGLSNAALAERLGKSTKTIANQLSSVYLKSEQHFGLSNPPDRAQLLVLLGSYS
jgi:CRISPR-associated Csx14 family protein